jgi:hypothetical protein
MTRARRYSIQSNSDDGKRLTLYGTKTLEPQSIAVDFLLLLKKICFFNRTVDKLFSTPFPVIPAQAGIQAFQDATGSPFSRG